MNKPKARRPGTVKLTKGAVPKLELVQASSIPALPDKFNELSASERLLYLRSINNNPDERILQIENAIIDLTGKIAGLVRARNKDTRAAYGTGYGGLNKPRALLKHYIGERATSLVIEGLMHTARAAARVERAARKAGRK